MGGLNIGRNEIVIDGGGFDGDTLAEFIQCYGGFQKYYLFEPERPLIEKAKLRFPEMRNIVYSQKALYDTTAEIGFKPDGSGMGAVQTTDLDKWIDTVQTIKIDDLAVAVSVIKLDVEGEEMRVLLGARETIARYRPQIAVSVYHRPDDIIDVYNYLKSIHSDYKIYFHCHYNTPDNDLVLIAV